MEIFGWVLKISKEKTEINISTILYKYLYEKGQWYKRVNIWIYAVDLQQLVKLIQHDNIKYLMCTDYSHKSAELSMLQINLDLQVLGNRFLLPIQIWKCIVYGSRYPNPFNIFLFQLKTASNFCVILMAP